MEIKVHRGLDQIGGCITEISTSTSRVFIDFGKNLPGCGVEISKDELSQLFESNRKKHEAVFYSHIHEDHIGLFSYITNNIPQYIGEGAKFLYQLKLKLLLEGGNRSLQDAKTEEEQQQIKKNQEELKHKIEQFDCFKTWKRTEYGEKPRKIQIGDIQITPFFCCHSVYDSYMFLIEAGGERIWHTGDFREHGYMGKGLLPVLHKYATNIDVLITEGTMLGRQDNCIHEVEVASRMTKVMKQYKYIFVLCSSTDIERLASVKKATEWAKKSLYVDGAMSYGAMKLFTKRENKVSKGLFKFKPAYLDMSKSNWKDEGFALTIGVSHYEKVMEIKNQLPEDEVVLIYSCWEGYCQIPEQIVLNPNYKNFYEAFKHKEIIHTSGHADSNTLKKVIETIRPKKQIIGIHKEAGASLLDLDLSKELRAKIKQ